jgi:2-iminobutanoate/2-iminopropanoate deaminase
MLMPEEVRSTRAPQAIGPYAQAVAVGEWIYCSGQIGLDPVTGELVPGGMEAEVDRALNNLQAVLEAAGSGLQRLVRVTVYLTDLGEFATLNRIYAERLGNARPARATVGVAALPKGACVEIEAVALRDWAG